MSKPQTVSKYLNAVLHLLQAVSVHIKSFLKANPTLEAAVNSKIVIPANRFYKSSSRFMVRCTKPSRKEYKKMAISVLYGLLVMGVIGFLVKLVHIPINNIIVGPK